MNEGLRIDGLSAGYGDTQVLWDVSLEVGAGEVVALIGSNGAGKSTLLGAVSGQVDVWGGSIRSGERELAGVAPDRVVAAGVVQVPQGRRLFGGLTVEENLLMGTPRCARDRRRRHFDLERILSLLPRLRERLGYLAGRLSGGELAWRRSPVARALMARPNVLLIDEMSLGLAPVLVDALLDILREIHAGGVTILMVEQDVEAALEFAQRAYVLETGRITLAGSAAQLRDDPRVQKAYLGV